MREIKFRAWNKEQKVMYEVKKVDFSEQKVFCEQYYLNDLKFSEIELMQYIGFKDKNGKEIFEGDIVEYETCILDKDNKYNLSLKGYRKSEVKNNAPWAFSPWWDDYVLEPEVIGNVYEGLHNVKQ